MRLIAHSCNCFEKLTIDCQRQSQGHKQENHQIHPLLHFAPVLLTACLRVSLNNHQIVEQDLKHFDHQSIFSDNWFSDEFYLLSRPYSFHLTAARQTSYLRLFPPVHWMPPLTSISIRWALLWKLFWEISWEIRGIFNIFSCQIVCVFTTPNITRIEFRLLHLNDKCLQNSVMALQWKVGFQTKL